MNKLVFLFLLVFNAKTWSSKTLATFYNYSQKLTENQQHKCGNNAQGNCCVVIIST